MRTVVVASVCAEPELIEAGRQMAKRRRQSFSQYMATLLERDLEREGNPVEVSQTPKGKTEEVAS